MPPCLDELIIALPGIKKCYRCPWTKCNLCGLHRGRRSLPEIVRGFKSVTTREYNRLVPAEKNNTLWQGSYYDTVLRSEAHYLTVRQYIDENPIRWTEDEYFTPPEP